MTSLPLSLHRKCVFRLPDKFHHHTSVTMTTSKGTKLVQACHTLKNKQSHTIREVASVVGLMVANFSGVKHDPPFYRCLENEKTDTLKLASGNLDSRMLLSEIAIKDLYWWVHNCINDPQLVQPELLQCVLKCDSSLQGWGSYLDGTWVSTGGLNQNHCIT